MKSIMVKLAIIATIFSGANADMCTDTLNQCIQDCGRYPSMCSTCQTIMDACYAANQAIINNLWFYHLIARFITCIINIILIFYRYSMLASLSILPRSIVYLSLRTIFHASWYSYHNYSATAWLLLFFFCLVEYTET